jgi:hypothetical protein
MKSEKRKIEGEPEEVPPSRDGVRQAPLSEADYDKLTKHALHAMAARLVRSRHTDKTSAVVEQAKRDQGPAEASAPTPSGHERNRAGAFVCARKAEVPHQSRSHGVSFIRSERARS